MNTSNFWTNTILTIVFVFLLSGVINSQNNTEIFDKYFIPVDNIVPIDVDLSGSLRLIYKNDNFYVMDLNRSQIFVFNSNGENLATMGRHGRGPGEFERLNSITLSDTKIYAYDLALRKIVIFSHKGKFLNEYRLKSKSIHPQHIFYQNEKLYIYSTNFAAEHMIQVIDSNNGNILNNFAKTTSQIKEIGYPLNGLVTAFSLNKNEEVYVTHFIDFTVRKYNSEGTLLSTFLAKDRLFDQPNPEGYSPPMPLESITDATINHFFANSNHIFVGYKHNEFQDLSFEILNTNGNRIYPNLVKFTSKTGTPLFFDDNFMITGKYFDTEDGSKIGFVKYSININ